MKLTNTTLFLLLCFACYGQPLPPLPMVLQWDEAGLRIQALQSPGAGHSLFNPVSAQCFERLGQDLLGLTSGESCPSITIDVSGLFVADEALSNEDLVPKGSPDRQINLEQTSAIRDRNVDDGSFTLEIAGLPSMPGGFVQEIVFKGLDVLTAEVDDGASYLVERRRVVRIDVKKCTNRLMVFRGGQLRVSDFVDKIPELGEKYNRKYTEYDAFVYENKESVGVKWDFEHVRKLITNYNITDFEDRPLLYLENMLVTRNGLGMHLFAEEDYRKRPRSYLGFLSWSDLLNLKMERYWNDRKIKLTSNYRETWYSDGSRFFSNVELIQFMEELRALVRSSVKAPE